MEFIRGKIYIDKYGKKWKAVIRREDKKPILIRLGKFGNITRIQGNWYGGKGLTLENNL